MADLDAMVQAYLTHLETLRAEELARQLEAVHARYDVMRQQAREVAPRFFLSEPARQAAAVRLAVHLEVLDTLEAADLAYTRFSVAMQAYIDGACPFPAVLEQEYRRLYAAFEAKREEVSQ